MIPPGLLLERFLADREDVEAAEWLRGRIDVWKASTGRLTFAEAFGISDNSLTFARDLRDYWLRQAAHALLADHNVPPEKHAGMIHDALERYGLELARWEQEGLPEDPGPDQFALALYFARRSGVLLALGKKQLGRILDMDGKNVSGSMCNDDSNKPEDRDNGLPHDASEFRTAAPQPDDPEQPQATAADRALEPRGGAVQPGARDRGIAARPGARRARR